MPLPLTALEDVRVEAAFDASPDATVPGWVDVTSRAYLDRGIEIERGRLDQYEAVRPARCTVTFDNTDGALTPGAASSPYGPNVKAQNRLRITYRDRSVPANFVDATSATFEGGSVGSWTVDAGMSIASDTTRAFSGSRSGLITWPTAAANGASAALDRGTPLVKGRTYTARARVWVPSGSPPVRLAFVQSLFPVYGSPSTTTGAWELISVTFTSNEQQLYLVVRANAASTAGQQVWIDEVQVDEAVAPATFTTTDALTQVIRNRFTGYVHEWPLTWPEGGQTHATSTVTAYDLSARLSRFRTFGSVIEETYRLLTPSWYFPLDEPDTSVSAGDRMDTGSTLAVTQYGGGGAGTIAFSAATGPPTDGAQSPTFTPASFTSGKYLSGAVPNTAAWTNGITLTANYAGTAPPAAADAVVAQAADPYGTALELAVNAAGKATANYNDPFTGVTYTQTSTVTVTDGQWHDLTTSLEIVIGTNTKRLRLYVDGVQQGGFNTFDSLIFLPTLSSYLYVGGTPNGGRLISGSIAHVAAFGYAVTAGQALSMAQATTTGFAGETTDQRITRVLSWAGIPTSLQNLDVGLTPMSHVESDGLSPQAYLDLIAQTEAGAVFIGLDGRVTFHARSRRYDTAAPVVVSVASDDVDPDTALRHTIEDVVNVATASRPTGATIVARNTASIAAYGVSETQATVATSSDGQLVDRAYWMVNEAGDPVTKLPQLTLDALTAAASVTARALELGDRVAVTTVPSQSPTTSFDLRTQGYSERISAAEWRLTVNATPFLVLLPLILDDAVYGLLDANNRLTY